MSKTLSENHSYIIEINSSKKNWYEEESFVYMGEGKKYDCRNSAFLASKKKLSELRKEHPDQIYRLIFKTDTTVLINI